MTGFTPALASASWFFQAGMLILTGNFGNSPTLVLAAVFTALAFMELSWRHSSKGEKLDHHRRP